MVSEKKYAVILAGGGGTRLWPKSRDKLPKQFLKLVDHNSFLQATFERIRGHFPEKNIFVVTSRSFVSEVRRQLRSVLEENIILEPSAKNTAAAAALAASLISKIDPDAIITVLASDHFIKEKAKFLKFLSISQKAAEKSDSIVIIGGLPTYPHTGLGYIHVGSEAFKISGVPIFKVKAFKEKPDAPTARAYFASSEYFWNANINTYKAKVILSAIKKHLPQLSSTLKKMLDNKDEEEKGNLWKKLPNVPIDTAILEKANNVLVVPSQFSWTDVGDWASVHSILSARDHYNVILGHGSEHLDLGTQGSLIFASNKLVTTIGVKDLIIIDTPDILLVCSKSRAQEVKKIVERLKREKKSKYL